MHNFQKAGTGRDSTRAGHKGGEMNLPFIVNEMLHYLYRRDFTACIAGGAVRDIHAGCVPHDWDIVVVNRGGLDERDVFHALEDLCHYFRREYPAETFTSVTQAYESASGDFDARWLGLGQVEFVSSSPGASASMDILFAREPNIELVLSGFDSNVNQCYLHRGNPVYPWGVPEELTFLKPITVARFNRLVDVAACLHIPINPIGLEIES